MILTEEQVKKMLPLNVNYVEWTKLFNELLPKYNITTKDRIVMFMAQCAHESTDFTRLKENLNYSATGLLKIFKKYFNEADAKLYERKPQAIANRVYANRMGNGDEKSGDGYKFSGKGVIQLTGKNNITAFASYMNMSVDDVCKYLLTNRGALEGGCYYWNKNNINNEADTQDILGATKKINGGTIGILERTQKYNVISTII